MSHWVGENCCTTYCNSVPRSDNGLGLIIRDGCVRWLLFAVLVVGAPFLLNQSCGLGRFNPAGASLPVQWMEVVWTRKCCIPRQWWYITLVVGATIFLVVHHSCISVYFTFQYLCGISVQWVAVYLSWYVGACHLAASCWVRKQRLYPKTGSGYCWCWGESGRLYKYYKFLWVIITPLIYGSVCA